jgi:hypothetical protein
VATVTVSLLIDWVPVASGVRAPSVTVPLVVKVDITPPTSTDTVVSAAFTLKGTAIRVRLAKTKPIFVIEGRSFCVIILSFSFY